MTSKAWEISGLTTPTESATAPSVTDDADSSYVVGRYSSHILTTHSVSYK